MSVHIKGSSCNSQPEITSIQMVKPLLSSDKVKNSFVIAGKNSNHFSESANTNSFTNEPSNSNLGNQSAKAVDIISVWALNETNIPKSAISHLITMMQPLHKDLPQTYQTLLPPSKLTYSQINEAVYFPTYKSSLCELLQKCYKRNSRNKIFYFCLLINIDGLLLFKHSPDLKFYPILVSLYDISIKPLCAGIHLFKHIL